MYVTDLYLLGFGAGFLQGEEGWQKGLCSSQTSALNLLLRRSAEGFRCSVKQSIIYERGEIVLMASVHCVLCRICSGEQL